MTNQTVLVTGAGSGIGRATALRFSEAGANLILVGRNVERLESISFDARKKGVEVETHALDLSDTAATLKFFSKIKKLDIAVNNAGIEGKMGDITTLELENFEELMNVNLKSLWLCMREEVRFFREKKQKGNIVNVSSVLGLIGIPNSSLYVASKHAVNGLTKSVALEQIKHGIRINSICPGAVETPMLKRIYKGDLSQVETSGPSDRIGKASEIADSICWLASPSSEFVVGHCLVVDGGMTVG